jgi:glycerophosphoryl diester phosphodiesterase
LDPGALPVIVAHRGFPQSHPENTIAAMQAAVDAGAKWLEVDVQLRDGKPVLAHDPDLSGEEETLDEFACWLEARPVTAFVDLKGESLREYGADAVVDAVLRVMRGRWHPISFSYGALRKAKDRGSPEPGWVVCDHGEETLAAAQSLGARWLIINQIFIQGDLPGPWEWMVYEIENEQQARDALNRGARWLETMRYRQIKEALENGTGSRAS